MKISVVKLSIFTYPDKRS